MLVTGCGGGDTTTIIQNGGATTTVSQGETDPVLFPSHCTDQAFQPVEIVLSCGDAQLRIEDLTWTGWDASTATGHGSLTYPTCPPNVALADCTTRGSAATTVTLDQPQYCANVKHHIFTRLHSVAPTATGTGGDGNALADFTRPFGCALLDSAATTKTPPATTRSTQGGVTIAKPSADDYHQPLRVWPTYSEPTKGGLAALFLTNNPGDCAALTAKFEDAPIGVQQFVDRAASEPRLQDTPISNAMLVYCQKFSGG